MQKPSLFEAPNSDQNQQTFLSPRFLDFWLIGGASIFVWLVMMIAEFYRNDSNVIQQKFQSVAITFGMLSLLCNHPHFMASYRIAYGKPKIFFRQHWFVMGAVPALMILFYGFTFFYAQTSLDGLWWIDGANSLLTLVGISFRLGEMQNLGVEFLGLSVWFMNLTVGWHYAKQTFGCAVVYSIYDRYPLNLWQKRVLKFCVYSVAFYSLCHISFHWRDYSSYSGGSYQYLGLPMTELGLPAIFEAVAGWLVVVGVVLAVYGIFWKNRQILKKWPSLNFFVPIAAFYLWWIPVVHQKEYYFMMVPFFHSLQYLAFVFRMEKSALQKKPHAERRFAFRLILLSIAGFLAFELVPAILDSHFSSDIGSFPLFFAIAFLVFINVHHFFLDSVLWRSTDHDFRTGILGENDPRRVKA